MTPVKSAPQSQRSLAQEPTSQGVDPAQVETLRAFNRFYTGKLGFLGKQMLNSHYSLTEVRILYEIANFKKDSLAEKRASIRAADLLAKLDLDAGYLSRCLGQFDRAGLIARKADARDLRQRNIQLTARGRAEFKKLNQASIKQIETLLQPLTPTQRVSTVQSALTLQKAFDSSVSQVPIELDDPRPGDLGWVVARHGALYAQEFGYNIEFEALVAEIVGQFVQQFDPARERCWIARSAGRSLGSVFLVKVDESTAKLRLLILEPEARGMRLGERLVQTCMDHARALGYQRMVLWTQSHLDAARRIYARLGWEKVGEESHKSFGLDLVAETWQVEL